MARIDPLIEKLLAVPAQALVFEAGKGATLLGSGGPQRLVQQPLTASQIAGAFAEIAPHDLRTADATRAAEIYAGRFVFAGKIVTCRNAHSGIHISDSLRSRLSPARECVQPNPRHERPAPAPTHRLVDGSYASTTPQTVSGILAEVKFTALKECQTGLTLESAALAIRNPEGFAAPLSGVSIGERNLSLNIDRQVAAPQPAQVESSGSILPLAPPKAEPGIPLWMTIGIMFAILAASLMFGTFQAFRTGTAPKGKASNPASAVRKAALHIKHGPQAGRSFSLNKLPILIGRDPQNDICINDPHLINHHAQIYSKRNGYYLRDLGGGTFAIEQDADVVMFIHRQDMYDRDNLRPNVAQVKVAKHRNGPTGKIELIFRSNLAKFENAATRNVDLSKIA